MCFPLYPRKRTQVGHPAMSVWCQKRTLGKVRLWREAAVRPWDELATEDLAPPVDATHLQHDQLKLLKLLKWKRLAPCQISPCAHASIAAIATARGKPRL